MKVFDGIRRKKVTKSWKKVKNYQKFTVFYGCVWVKFFKMVPTFENSLYPYGIRHTTQSTTPFELLCPTPPPILFHSPYILDLSPYILDSKNAGKSQKWGIHMEIDMPDHNQKTLTWIKDFDGNLRGKVEKSRKKLKKWWKTFNISSSLISFSHPLIIPNPNPNPLDPQLKVLHHLNQYVHISITFHLFSTSQPSKNHLNWWFSLMKHFQTLKFALRFQKVPPTL